ncbi:17507_t:CDS:1 [Cetraspora pellucida]|uniref:17507_t:CDS:1 n=1 Tax=Cetraspora pellucida TaxID=1433469 RepID=A0A9N9C269_9GLOM|nr:17507_t:CDS:1 [Cetraspora pellucida]
MLNSTSEVNANSTQVPSVTISPDINNNPIKNRGNYVKAACRPCALAKVKCSGNMPCDRCSKQEKECLYEPQRKRGPKIRRSRSTSCDNRHRQQDDLQPSSLRRTRSNCDRRRSISPSEVIRSENDNALGISFSNILQCLTENNLQPDYYIANELNYLNPALLSPGGVFSHQIVVTPPQPGIMQNNYQPNFPHSPQSGEWQYYPEFSRW